MYAQYVYPNWIDITIPYEQNNALSYHSPFCIVSQFWTCHPYCASQHSSMYNVYILIELMLLFHMNRTTLCPITHRFQFVLLINSELVTSTVLHSTLDSFFNWSFFKFLYELHSSRKNLHAGSCLPPSWLHAHMLVEMGLIAVLARNCVIKKQF